MGRTLHFEITKDDGNFTKSEQEIMHRISNLYNSDKLKEMWTCESFYIGEFEKKNQVRGFVKVQGNEWNSMLVYIALIHISIEVPKATVHLADEGEFLLCELFIKQGKVLPDLDALKDQMAYWALMLVFDKKRVHRYVAASRFKRIIDKVSRDEISFNTEWGNLPRKILNQTLDRYAEVTIRLKSLGLTDQEMFHFNIKHRRPENWFDPQEFCRKVNPEDFVGYEGGVSCLMDGFHGEAFGMATEDAEKKSYEVADFFKKIADSMGQRIEFISPVQK